MSGPVPWLLLTAAAARLEAGDRSGARRYLELLADNFDVPGRVRLAAEEAMAVLRERGPAAALAALEGWLEREETGP